MYSLDIDKGLVREARWVASPNCDDRPEGCLPELIVVHGISLPPGEFGGDWIDQFFTNSLRSDAHPYFGEIGEMRVAAHFVIRRDGELVQYVPLGRRAWHAGHSSFEGREGCNDFSVGIELEGVDDSAYADVQYAALAALISALRASIVSLANASIVGHSDISPGRKTDPGPAFDWPRLTRLLAKAEA
jgi:AmpD protein